MKKILCIIALLVSLYVSGQGKMAKKPNVVIIFGDDIGFSDIGCYGSEISTPNLDYLAKKGIRFSQFYNGAKCQPTRNSLFTGLYTGDDRAMSFEGLMHNNGYTVIHSGKEHFDSWVPERCFAVNTSDHAFTFWAATNFFIPPDSAFSQPLFLNGKEIHPRELEKMTGKPFYMTDFITDMGIKWMDEALNAKKDKPFLLVLPYNAAHWPLQAYPEDIAKYRNLYRQGWDKIRASRFAKMQKLGIVAKNIQLSKPENDPTAVYRPRNDGHDDMRKLLSVYSPWDKLTIEQQDYFSLEMAVYVAMIDRMDQNIGKIIQELKKKGIEDNTIIMYFSDNGACPFERNRDLVIPPGGADSWRTLSTCWANVGNTPFRFYKQNGHEGGSHNHFIVSWPAMIKPGTISDELTHVVDIFPTLLDITGISYPKEIDGETSIPLNGTSLLPVFKGQDRKDPEYVLSGFTEKKRMYRKDNWQIVKLNGGDWELYNLKKDPVQLNNLALKNPDMLESMVNSYQDIRVRTDSYLKKDIRKVNYPYQIPGGGNGIPLQELLKLGKGDLRE